LLVVKMKFLTRYQPQPYTKEAMDSGIENSFAVNTACPWLPAISARLRAESMSFFRENRGADFQRAALCYAQSLWIEGKPAQAILQINKSFMADARCADGLSAYRALGWIMRAAADDGAGFMGNPVRHFQHLATRMSGPRAEIRRWRAWACFHLAEKILPDGFHRDGRQMAREGIWIPGNHPVIAAIERLGWPGEAECILAAVSENEALTKE